MSVATSLLGALLVFAAGSAQAQPAPPPEVLPDTVEEQTYALLDTLLEMLEERDAKDEIVALEAEEIHVIAEEFLAEGDAEIAMDLLEEAIALLTPPEQE